MTESVPTWLGISCLLLIVAFVAFAYRQGMKVKKEPKGVPPETTWPTS